MVLWVIYCRSHRRTWLKMVAKKNLADRSKDWLGVRGSIQKAKSSTFRATTALFRHAIGLREMCFQDWWVQSGLLDGIDMARCQWVIGGGYGREVLKRMESVGWEKKKLDDLLRTQRTCGFWETGLFRLMAELIFLRRYGLQHKYASENGFLVVTASG